MYRFLALKRYAGVQYQDRKSFVSKAINAVSNIQKVKLI